MIVAMPDEYIYVFHLHFSTNGTKERAEVTIPGVTVE